MKKLYLILALILFMSCNSDDSDTSIKKSLEGKWSLVQTSGGITGSTDTPESLNAVIYIEFSGSTLKEYSNGKLTHENTFAIKTQKSIFGEDRPMLVSDNPDKYFIPKSFRIEGNNLYLSDECADCFGSSYTRIK